MKIGRLLSGGLIVNYYCSSKCKHCQYGSSQEWSKDYLRVDMANKIADIFIKKGLKSIHIGGGEPFLNYSKLIKVLKVLQAKNIRVEYIETNSSWFVSSQDTQEKLKEIKSLGVNCIMMSVSPFHNEYIPFYKVKGLINACQILNFDYFNWIDDFYDDINAFDDKSHHSFDEYSQKYGKDYMTIAANRYRLNIKGRALKTFAVNRRNKSLKEILDEKSNCSNLANTGHFHIDLYGNYLPSSCMGLSIDIDDLDKKLDEKKYEILNALYHNGISSLYDLAMKKGFKANDYYFNKCDLCQDIRSFLSKINDYPKHEISPVEYYKRV